jgi:cellulase
MPTSTWETVRDYQKGSIQRQWSWDALDPNDPYIACGNPGTPLNVSYHASVRAGSTIDVTYLGWPHSHGPMMAYLAACPEEGCESVDLKQAVWFKIWQEGLLSGDLVDGEWAMAKMVGDITELRIPLLESVKPGKYLLKHDMANLEGGRVQLFVNCVQLDVGGEGVGSPKEEELVAFPGGYDKDAGKIVGCVMAGMGLRKSGLSWANTNIGQGAEWLYLNHAKDTVSLVRILILILIVYSIILCRVRRCGKDEPARQNGYED